MDQTINTDSPGSIKEAKEKGRLADPEKIIDAIEKDGMIHIKTQKDDSRIVISIKDNGPGISKENLQKVFDPFFTTKEAGKGTGLGLSASYNIIEKLGGTITVESKLSEGTVFKVKLPIVIPEKK